jgi:hypothetical protein
MGNRWVKDEENRQVKTKFLNKNISIRFCFVNFTKVN